MDVLVKVAGSVLVITVCACVGWSLSKELWFRIRSGAAVDRNLSDVDRENAPGMFWLQIVGGVLLIGAAASIGISLVVNLVTQFLSSS